MSGNLLRKMPVAALYAQLGRLIESMPAFAELAPDSTTRYRPLTPDEMLWLGRAESLVSEALGLSGQVEFKTIMGNFDQYRAWAATEIAKIIYRALAQVEIELPVPTTGAFIPAGSAFDAVKALQRIFATTAHDLFIVDPYLDSKFLTEFAELIPENVTARLLTDGSGKPAT